MSNLARNECRARPARKRLRPEDRRALILGAAAEAFGRAGYDGARLDAIAADAGVTKPVLYRHFASKEDLYLALLDQHREELPEFVAGLPADVPLEDFVRRILEGWFAYAEANGARWRMLFRDSGGTPAISDSRARMYGDARAVLAAFLRTHPAFEIPEAEVEPVAEAVRGALSSLVLLGQEDGRATRERLVAAGTLLVTGLARERGAG